MTNAEPKLPKVFKRRWVKALRSGEYTQGKQYLKAGASYCCLGVAGKICGVSDTRLAAHTLLAEGMIPKKAYEALIIRQESLASKNDSGWSFKRIATWIERYL
jgi:hypothetical protein